MRDNQDKQMTCDNSGHGSGARYCEVREQTTAAVGLLSVDPGENSGATVKGWSRNEVLVRSRVEGRGASDAGWSVSFEIFVPQATSLTLKTVNGGITVSDIRGSLRFEATNGGVNLTRLAGDVAGSTVNGGINLELAGTTWDGSQVQVTTENGGVRLKKV
jgi:hypothetical protein